MPRYEIVYTVLERSVPLCDRLCQPRVVPLTPRLVKLSTASSHFSFSLFARNFGQFINNIKKNRTTADGESFRHTNLKKKKKKHCKVTVKTMKNSYKLSVSVFKKPDLNYKTNIN